ncbi:MAG: MFS transporter [Gammaproteobacteria bacterium]
MSADMNREGMGRGFGGGGVMFTREMFSSLRHRDYRFLWVSNLGASFAMNMQMVARGWLIYALTSSPMSLFWVLLSFMAPSFVFSLVGGVIADRLHKKWVMLTGQTLNFGATLVLAIIIYTDNVTFWHFIYFGLFNGTVMSVSMPARAAIVPEIVGERDLVNAMALSSSSMNLSRIVGPATAGGIIGIVAAGDKTSTMGVGVVFFIIAALYLISIVTTASIHYQGAPAEREKKSVFADIGDGFSYMWGDKIVFGLMMMSFVPMLFGMPLQFLMPAFNQDILGGGADDLGLLMGAMGIGALAGSLGLARFSDAASNGRVMIGCAFVWAIFMGMFSFSQTLYWALPLAVITGGFSSTFMSLNMSMVQLALKPEMRGRVMSIFMMTFGLMPLGAAPMSLIAEHFGIDYALQVSALLLAVTIVGLAIAFPAIRKLDRGWEPQGLENLREHPRQQHHRHQPEAGK